MTVTKILEQTLPVGSTSVSFTDADIPNSLIRVFSSNPDIIPVSRTLINTTLTVTYEAQAAALDVAVEIVKQGLDIVDNVLSEDTDKALSAKQGYILKAAIDDNADNIQTLSDNLDTLSDNLDTLSDRVDNLDIPDNIIDLNDVEVSDIQSGQVLAWNGTKFVNVDQSGGSSGVDYSFDEQNTGIKWIDGSDIYQKTIRISNYSVSLSNNAWTNIVQVHGLSYILNSIIHYQSPNLTFQLRFKSGPNYYIQGASITSCTLSSLGTIDVTFFYTKNS